MYLKLYFKSCTGNDEKDIGWVEFPVGYVMAEALKDRLTENEDSQTAQYVYAWESDLLANEFLNNKIDYLQNFSPHKLVDSVNDMLGEFLLHIY